MSYRAPVSDMLATMRHVAGLDRLIADGLAPELEGGVAKAVLEEAAKFAADVIAPLNRVGDALGSKLKDGAVTTPPGWRRPTRPGPRPAGTRCRRRKPMAGRACRPCCNRPASRCGTRPPSPSRSARC